MDRERQTYGKCTYGARLRVITGYHTGRLLVSLGHRYVESMDNPEAWESAVACVDPNTNERLDLPLDSVVVAYDEPKLVPFEDQDRWPLLARTNQENLKMDLHGNEPSFDEDAVAQALQAYAATLISQVTDSWTQAVSEMPLGQRIILYAILHENLKSHFAKPQQQEGEA